MRKTETALDGRGVEVEDRGDERDRQDHAEGDPPAQLVPDREEGDLAADTLALREAAVEEVGQDRDDGAEEKLEHLRPPCPLSRGRRRARADRWGLAGRRTAGRSSARRPGRPVAAGEPFERQRDRVHRGREVGQLDQREQQRRDPEDAVVGEERQQREHGDELQLHLVGAMRHVLGQRVELQVDQADRNDGDEQKDGHHRHQPVRLAGTVMKDGRSCGAAGFMPGDAPSVPSDGCVGHGFGSFRRGVVCETCDTSGRRPQGVPRRRGAVGRDKQKGGLRYRSPPQETPQQLPFTTLRHSSRLSGTSAVPGADRPAIHVDEVRAVVDADPAAVAGEGRARDLLDAAAACSRTSAAIARR